jgi:hypothetical protein
MQSDRLQKFCEVVTDGDYLELREPDSSSYMLQVL